MIDEKAFLSDILSLTTYQPAVLTEVKQILTDTTNISFNERSTPSTFVGRIDSRNNEWLFKVRIIQ